MEYRPLKLTLLSAKEIKNMNTFSKQDAYAVVSLVGYPNSKQKTPVHTDCGTKPKWDHDMEFVVDEPYLTKPGLSLLVEIFNECAFRSDKLIGSVTLPVDDLFGSNSSDEHKTFTYQVLTDGKPKGELKLSYKFGEKFTQGGDEKEKEVKDQPLPAHPVPTAHPEYPPQYAPPPQGGYGGYPPQYAPPPQAGYGGYPPQYAPPPQAGYGGYAPPPQAGYGGYPPQTSGYGHQYPPQPGYGYPPQAGYGAYPSGEKSKKSGMGTGAAVGLGVGAGLVGGLLVADAMDDFGDAGDMGDF